jgi:hypothetical protein
MNQQGVELAAKRGKFIENDGKPLRTELSLRLPMMSRRDRRQIELGARRIVKKQMRKVKHG